MIMQTNTDRIRSLEDDADFDRRRIQKLTEENKRLTSLLEECLPYIVSQNDAEGLLDGFRPRQPRRSDSLLKTVREVCHKEESE